MKENRSGNNKREYNKQRKYCVSLLRKRKTNNYTNLNEKDLTAILANCLTFTFRQNQIVRKNNTGRTKRNSLCGW